MAPHAVARERLAQADSLLGLAEYDLQSNWELFKALLIGAITLGDSVRDLIHAQDARAPGFLRWEKTLEQQWPALEFFRKERNFAMHQGPSRLHGLGYRHTGTRFRLVAPGETPPPEPTPPPAEPPSREAYFDDHAWGVRTAGEYVADYLADLAAVIDAAEVLF